MEAEKAGRGVRLLSYGLLVMNFTHTLTHVFQRIHLVLFPVIRVEYSLSIRQLGLIAAIPPLCQAVLSIPTGLLSDRSGAKGMILVSLAIAAFGTFITSMTLSPLMLTVARARHTASPPASSSSGRGRRPWASTAQAVPSAWPSASSPSAS